MKLVFDWTDLAVAYPSLCCVCSKAMNVKEQAHWSPTSGAMICQECRLDATKMPAPGTPGGSLAKLAGTRNGDSWKKGLLGEQLIGQTFDRVPGLLVLHDRTTKTSRANIDHIVVTPSGVWVIDSKNWSGVVSPHANGVSRNGRGDPKTLSGLDKAVSAVKQAIAGSDLQVFGALVFPQEADLVPDSFTMGDNYLVAHPDTMVKVFHHPGGSLSESQAKGLLRGLAEALPPALKPDPPGSRPATPKMPPRRSSPPRPGRKPASQQKSAPKKPDTKPQEESPGRMLGRRLLALVAFVVIVRFALPVIADLAASAFAGSLQQSVEESLPQATTIPAAPISATLPGQTPTTPSSAAPPTVADPNSCSELASLQEATADNLFADPTGHGLPGYTGKSTNALVPLRSDVFLLHVTLRVGGYLTQVNLVGIGPAPSQATWFLESTSSQQALPYLPMADAPKAVIEAIAAVDVGSIKERLSVCVGQTR